MKIYLDTIGCRLNQAEIESYSRQFYAAGHTLIPTPEGADLVVVNTCAVTAAAVSDSRQKIRQAAGAFPGEIAVTGCWSTLDPQSAASLPRVSQVIPNPQKDSLVADLLHLPQESFALESVRRHAVPGRRLRTRAFIKVQDGCDNYCTFCVTRLARGAGRSRPLEDVLADIRAALCSNPGEQGAQEVVITGVHLGSWGSDLPSGLHLRHLVKAILEETDALRLRLSSLEPWDLDAEFFSLWENPRLCRHLHLPLQSGCPATLRRMRRKTTPQSFADLVAAARAAIPGVAITTDVIVGFPGEDEAEFSESLAFVSKIGFAGGHVFTYSARPGTPAARMRTQVPHKLRKERSQRMRSVLAEATCSYQSSFLGAVLPVLWENTVALGPQGWRLSGLTDNYLRVTANAPRQMWNQITPVRLSALQGDGLLGQLESQAAE